MRQRQRRPDDGFTLIEVVVALALFGVLAGTVSVALASVLKETRNNQNRTVAANIAQRVIDRVHAVGFADIPLGRQPLQQVRNGGNVFTVAVRTTLVPADRRTGDSACDGTGPLNSRLISVEVSWTGRGAARPVRSETQRRASYSDLNSSFGTVTVEVVDRDSRPAPGHVVSLNPGGLSATSDEEGCAVFAGLTPGAYAVALGTPGYVDRLGNSTPSRPVTAVAGEVVRDPGFGYDRAASLTLHLALAGSGGLSRYEPLPGTGASLGGSGFAGGAQGYPVCPGAPCAFAQPATTTSGPTLRLDNLFPAADGYRPWAGACADARPGTLPAPVTLAPGGSGNATVQLAPVEVTVRRSATDHRGVDGATVTVRHVADPGCPASSATVQAKSNSALADLSLPAGTWTFQVGTGPPLTATVVVDGSTRSLTVFAA